MGMAAAFVTLLIALSILAAIAYGTFTGLERAGRFLWWLLVEPADRKAAWSTSPQV